MLDTSGGRAEARVGGGKGGATVIRSWGFIGSVQVGLRERSGRHLYHFYHVRIRGAV
jgi:hypothetical protein